MEFLFRSIVLLATRGQPPSFAGVAQYLVSLGSAKTPDLQNKGTVLWQHRKTHINLSFTWFGLIPMTISLQMPLLFSGSSVREVFLLSHGLLCWPAKVPRFWDYRNGSFPFPSRNTLVHQKETLPQGWILNSWKKSLSQKWALIRCESTTQPANECELMNVIYFGKLVLLDFEQVFVMWVDAFVLFVRHFVLRDCGLS